jgi:uncharacterized membrane protein
MSSEGWARATAITSGLLTARLRRAASSQTAIEALAGAAFYALLLWVHPVLFGVDPLAMLRQ